MKTLIRMSVMILACMTGKAFANDAFGGLYVSVGTGVSKTKSIKTSDIPILYKLPNLFRVNQDAVQELTFKNGRYFRVALGKKVGNVRIELEPSYNSSKYKLFTQNGRALLSSNKISGFMRSLSVLANGYHDMPITEKFIPYIGAGLGLAYIKNQIQETGLRDFTRLGNPELPTFKASMSDKKFVYQGILGMSVNLSQAFSATLDYRYFGSAKLKALDGKIQRQSINLGLMYKI